MDNLPREVASNDVEIMGVKVTVVVLDNGQRLIAGDGIFRILEAMGEMTEDDAKKLVQVIYGIKGEENAD